jgi:alkylhydroperoxidase family enzyme
MLDWGEGKGFMAARLEFYKLAPEGMAKLTDLEHSLNATSGLERSLMDMVRLRASLMNGCEYCISSAHCGVEEIE